MSGGNETNPRPGAAPEPPTHPGASKTSSVVVIGAGMSGLCAARALVNAGFTNVKIIEARDYIGGRTVTKEVGNSGVMVDAGAAWMHGTKDNPLVALCEEYGLPYVPHPEMKTSNAAIVEVSDDYKERVAWTAEEAAMLSSIAFDIVPTLKPGTSAVDSFKAFCDGRSDMTDGQKARCQFMLEQIIGGAAGPMDDLQVFYPMTQQTGRLAEGYDQLIIGGYNSLIAKLADGLDIELEKVVEKIEYTNDKKVSIKCKDGSHYMTDYVICSIPLGVLKANAGKFVIQYANEISFMNVDTSAYQYIPHLISSNLVEFTPELPQRMTHALSKLAMGGFEKVVLVWDDHFYKGWKEEMDEVCAYI